MKKNNIDAFRRMSPAEEKRYLAKMRKLENQKQDQLFNYSGFISNSKASSKQLIAKEYREAIANAKKILGSDKDNRADEADYKKVSQIIEKEIENQEFEYEYQNNLFAEKLANIKEEDVPDGLDSKDLHRLFQKQDRDSYRKQHKDKDVLALFQRSAYEDDYEVDFDEDVPNNIYRRVKGKKKLKKSKHILDDDSAVIKKRKVEEVYQDPLVDIIEHDLLKERLENIKNLNKESQDLVKNEEIDLQSEHLMDLEDRVIGISDEVKDDMPLDIKAPHDVNVVILKELISRLDFVFENRKKRALFENVKRAIPIFNQLVNNVNNKIKKYFENYFILNQSYVEYEQYLRKRRKRAKQHGD